ncbi:endonuclease/exonuclease/phosphatase family protein [Putridiphycobacter roseus]|uniref:endonuclease/exonuclease/phosphatase family protein n=1 Tax=Putridiphycobacter roseus TaxID=2219161 RepID=UPI0013140B84|nr:endonuclease/exonuclease/phosphatase family protein [Putridiphycobacter roseus]
MFNIIIIGLGWNHLHNFYPVNMFSPAINSRSVKVLSYNVRIFNLYDKANRFKSRDGIFNFLKKEEADILCFQEFYHQENGSDFVTRDSLVKLLALDYYQERYTHKLLDEQYFGVATFSKYPIINKGEISFDNDLNNFCIYSDIVKDRDTLRVFNGHIGSIRFQDKDYAFFGDNEAGKLYQRGPKEQKILQRLRVAYEKRALQIEKIMVGVVASPYPVIFCSDLNDTPVSYAYQKVRKQLDDSFVDVGTGVGTTYIGKIPSNRIDYIFHDPKLQAVDFVTHDIHFSDHKPISVEINL